jgi:3-oxoadipate enol-lactonase
MTPSRDAVAQETGQSSALAQLVAAVLSVAPLSRALNAPARIPVGNNHECADMERILNHIGARLSGVQFDVIPHGTRVSSFDHAIAKRLELGAGDTPCRPRSDADATIAQVLPRIVDSSLQSPKYRKVIRASDGVPLAAYALGRRGNPSVVLIPPCGMPIELAQRWLHLLAEKYFVLSVETRYLFAANSAFQACATGISHQADDIFRAMEFFGVERAHVIGLCGGAVIALAAAACNPQKVLSLNLWHGDYELGDPRLTTAHQKDFRSLMLTVRSVKQAESLWSAFAQPSTFKRLRPDLAHLLLYPFASPDLLFRYGWLNGNIMSANTNDFLPCIPHPALVVTSADDETAHPAGSHAVAAALARAQLFVRPHGDHLSCFDADPMLTEVALGFIGKQQ